MNTPFAKCSKYYKSLKFESKLIFALVVLKNLKWSDPYRYNSKQNVMIYTTAKSTERTQKDAGSKNACILFPSFRNLQRKPKTIFKQVLRVEKPVTVEIFSIIKSKQTCATTKLKKMSKT